MSDHTMPDHSESTGGSIRLQQKNGQTPMRTSLIIILSVLILTAVGCEKKPDIQQRAIGPASSQDKQHAAADVVPGSHEDWCGGHKVPESMCTRCNPSLIPAFKATGDWCEEHGLPESQCLICNPDLKIERPPRSGGRSQ